VYIVSLLEELFIGNRAQLTFYYSVLEDYIIQHKNNRKIILTGHSLGGGIANIVFDLFELKSKRSKTRNHFYHILFSWSCVQQIQIWID
jgi:hypothetical protein